MRWCMLIYRWHGGAEAVPAAASRCWLRSGWSLQIPSASLWCIQWRHHPDHSAGQYNTGPIRPKLLLYMLAMWHPTASCTRYAACYSLSWQIPQRFRLLIIIDDVTEPAYITIGYQRSGHRRSVGGSPFQPGWIRQAECRFTILNMFSDPAICWSWNHRADGSFNLFPDFAY